jgi:hypothetical protein
MSLNLVKKGLECPGKVLEFHLHQRVDTLELGDCVGKAGGCGGWGGGGGGGGGGGVQGVLKSSKCMYQIYQCILIR